MKNTLPKSCCFLSFFYLMFSRFWPNVGVHFGIILDMFSLTKSNFLALRLLEGLVGHVFTILSDFCMILGGFLVYYLILERFQCNIYTYLHIYFPLEKRTGKKTPSRKRSSELLWECPSHVLRCLTSAFRVPARQVTKSVSWDASELVKRSYRGGSWGGWVLLGFHLFRCAYKCDFWVSWNTAPVDKSMTPPRKWHMRSTRYTRYIGGVGRDPYTIRGTLIEVLHIVYGLGLMPLMYRI